MGKAGRARSVIGMVVALSILALALAIVGCGGGGAKASEPTIVVTSRGYPEEEVLREIYAQALAAAGFAVVRHDLEPGKLAAEALREGLVSGYPDHLETVVTEALPAKVEDVPHSTQVAYVEAKKQLAADGVVPLPPAPFERSNLVGIPRKTAQRLNLKTLADLKEPSRTMSVIERELYCHGRAKCLGGLESGYGIVFGAFIGRYLGEPSSRLYKALRDGEADAVVLTTTDGGLARGKDWLVLFEDDEDRLPAANALWVTRKDVIDEAGPKYERAIVAAQKGLTLKVMRRLNAEVELDGKRPGDVAASYLRSIDSGVQHGES
jgi:glycine betaine/choline ABC-type transport system substrate-binding protein